MSLQSLMGNLRTYLSLLVKVTQKNGDYRICYICGRKYFHDKTSYMLSFCDKCFSRISSYSPKKTGRIMEKVRKKKEKNPSFNTITKCCLCRATIDPAITKKRSSCKECRDKGFT